MVLPERESALASVDLVDWYKFSVFIKVEHTFAYRTQLGAVRQFVDGIAHVDADDLLVIDAEVLCRYQRGSDVA